MGFEPLHIKSYPRLLRTNEEKKISENISSNIQDTCRKMIKLEKKKQKPTIQVEVVEMKIFRIFLEKDAMNLNSKKVKKKSFFYWRWVEKNCEL